MFESIDRVFLVTDLDGTLLSEDKTICPKNIEAIERFRAKGGRFSIATGRTLQTTIRYVEELSITDPMILYNGACVYDPVREKILHLSPLPETAYEYAKRIFEAFPQIGAEVLRPDGTYMVKMNSYEEKHAEYCTVPPVYCTIDEVPEGEWLKILFAMSPEEIEKLIEFAGAEGFGGVSFVRSDAIFYEMLPGGISKGSALNECRRILASDNLTFAAVGDYHNDLEMVINADIGAAPSNAQQCVREAADVKLRASCSDGAIAEFISVIESKIQI